MEKAKLKGKITNKDEYIKNLLEKFLISYFEGIFNNLIIKFRNLYVILYDKVTTLIKD